MKRLMVAVAAGSLLTGCGGGGVSKETVTVSETVTSVVVPTVISPTPASSPSVTTQVAPSETGAASAGSWVMPDLIGKNLQDAQNAIQVLTNYKKFFSSSTDLTGQGRQQIIDRNWQVCSSTPPPGATFTTDTAIDFGVVKKGSESCP